MITTPQSRSFVMPPTFKLQLSDGPLQFEQIVRLTHVDGEYIRNGKTRPKVHFTDYNRAAAQGRSGVSIVVQDGSKVLFCAEHDNPDETVAGRWLYARLGYLHWMYEEAAKAIEAGNKLEIYFSTRGNAGQIISELGPPWNYSGFKNGVHDSRSD